MQKTYYVGTNEIGFSRKLVFLAMIEAQAAENHADE